MCPITINKALLLQEGILRFELSWTAVIANINNNRCMLKSSAFKISIVINWVYSLLSSDNDEHKNPDHIWRDAVVSESEHNRSCLQP